MAAQPFYHAATVLFTLKDREMTADEFVAIVKPALIAALGNELVDHTVMCEDISGEPGDPGDL